MPAKTKTIEGKTYRLMDTHHFKTDAEKSAKYYRMENHSARVVKEDGRYCVYCRGK